MRQTIEQALRWARAEIEPISESARLDAEVLLAHCLDKPRSYLYAHPEAQLEDSRWQQFRQLVARRMEPTPIAYLLGTREFYSLDFHTGPQALVPRPETELLVELALQKLPAGEALKACDLGTGTGIIAITLKKERPAAEIYATDVDPGCLELARSNARQHSVDIEWIESDWYRGLPTSMGFDLIVSNPPYIAADHPFLTQGDLPAEPQLALTPGSTGLEALQQIISGAHVHLANGGYLILEHGYDQQAAVAELLAANAFTDIHCFNDLNGLPRASLAKRVENPVSAA